jgi:nicotinamide-nucleotide amidase
MQNTSIITIGDELLIGQVIDTNSAWMARELNACGIRVKRRVAVGDVKDDICKALDEELQHADVVLMTGGLGPTADDITKPLLCEYFGGKMVVDQGSLENVQYLFEKIYHRPITERNLRQAEVPDVCKVLVNKRGSAPGMVFEKNGKLVISMPGVPHEMQGMMTTDVIPLLQSRFSSNHIIHRTLVTFGIGESMLADHIQELENSLPQGIRLAYLPNYGMVRLRLTGSGASLPQITAEVEEQFFRLKSAVQQWLITDKDETIEQVIAGLCKERSASVSTAESCTGGYISHLLTAMPGSSSFYNGGVISYSNSLKQELLGVKESSLIAHGAVSEEVVREMLQGILNRARTTFGLAVSGIMGPNGGTPEKPVGTAWVAVGNNEKQLVQKFQFRFDRQRNIHMTSVNALNLLRQFIVQLDK